jgi:hypothetical protein
VDFTDQLFDQVDSKASNFPVVKIPIQSGYMEFQRIERYPFVPELDAETSIRALIARYPNRSLPTGIGIKGDVGEELLQDQPHILNAIGRESRAVSPLKHEFLKGLQ